VTTLAVGGVVVIEQAHDSNRSPSKLQFAASTRSSSPSKPTPVAHAAPPSARREQTPTREGTLGTARSVTPIGSRTSPTADPANPTQVPSDSPDTASIQPVGASPRQTRDTIPDAPAALAPIRQALPEPIRHAVPDLPAVPAIDLLAGVPSLPLPSTPLPLGDAQQPIDPHLPTVSSLDAPLPTPNLP
jgi:hypothetical protein